MRERAYNGSTSAQPSAAIAAARPALRLVRIPDAGHAPWLDDPRRVAEAIEVALTGVMRRGTRGRPRGARRSPEIRPIHSRSRRFGWM